MNKLNALVSINEEDFNITFNGVLHGMRKNNNLEYGEAADHPNVMAVVFGVDEQSINFNIQGMLKTGDKFINRMRIVGVDTNHGSLRGSSYGGWVFLTPSLQYVEQSVITRLTIHLIDVMTGNARRLQGLKLVGNETVIARFHAELISQYSSGQGIHITTDKPSRKDTKWIEITRSSIAQSLADPWDERDVVAHPDKTRKIYVHDEAFVYTPETVWANINMYRKMATCALPIHATADVAAKLYPHWSFV